MAEKYIKISSNTWVIKKRQAKVQGDMLYLLGWQKLKGR